MKAITRQGSWEGYRKRVDSRDHRIQSDTDNIEEQSR